ncbi:MAG TPA: rhomboid family intramembrane serine protease [Steroidobacteraceae bacterium]|nr:rhomboid family intramembrane serine protease [Steroidobacteraceae bacterium]
MVAIIPIRDASRRPTRFPLVTASIVALNVAAFILELAFGDAFAIRWAVIPAEISSGHHLLTIATAMFMHGSWLHIIGNMVFLWAFGPEIEDLMTPRRYLVFYLLGGLVAALAQVAAMPTSTVPMLGASGAIAAVMGAFIVTYPRDRIRSLLVILVFVSVTYVPAVLLIGVWFLTQFLSLGSVIGQSAGGVGYAAHVGGFIFGAVAARLFEVPPQGVS